MLEQGDGAVSIPAFHSDEDGAFSVTFTMGTVASRVGFLTDTEEAGGVALSTKVDFTPPPVPEPVWTLSRTETSLSLEMHPVFPEYLTPPEDTAGSSGGGNYPGSIEALVLQRSWEVWEDGFGGEEVRNETTGPAIGAIVHFATESGTGMLGDLSAVTDADGNARVSVSPGTGAGTADSVFTGHVTFEGVTANGELKVSADPWVLQQTEYSIDLTVEPVGVPATALAATVKWHRYDIWQHSGTGALSVRAEAVAPGENAEVQFASADGTAVQFASGTVSTDASGRAVTTYSSDTPVPVFALARFHGAAATTIFQAPVGSGDVTGGPGPGTGGPGPNGTDGPGPGTGGPGPDGTDGPGTDDDDHPEPYGQSASVRLKGRQHETRGGTGSLGEYISGNDGGTTTVDKIVSYSANLIRVVYEFDDTVSEERTERRTVSGSSGEELKEARRQWEANGWSVDGGITIETEPETIETQGSVEEYVEPYGIRFFVEGPKGVENDSKEVEFLATAEEMSEIYRARAETQGYNSEDDLEDHYWTGPLKEMGFLKEVWTKGQRIAHGANPYRSGAPLEAEASYGNGAVPSVKWSELWLQSEVPLPEGRRVTRTFLIHASQETIRIDDSEEDGVDETDEAEPPLEWFGTLSLEIVPQESISTEAASVNVGTAGPASAWISAKSDGTILLKPPFERGKRNRIRLLPVEVKVDYDRDGEDDILGDAGDSIPQGEQFRFWINDDNDEGVGFKARDAEPGNGHQNSADSSIHNLRDLEDFTRLHIDLSSFKSEIENGDMEIGLKMSGSGSIGVHYAADKEAGSENYLFEKSEAEEQTSHNINRYRTMEVNGQESWFKSTGPDGLSGQMNSDGHLHLIFEGITEGEGDIVLIFRPKDGDVFEGPRIPIKLLPVAKMFEHWTAGRHGNPSNSVVGDREAVTAAINAIPAFASKTTESGIFEQTGPEEDDIIVFVHGWRMEPWNQTSFGETSFKRLWHTGFKGRFFNFSWPTGYTPTHWHGGPPEDSDNFADSEQIAYHVGAKPLKNFLDYLDNRFGGKINLFAHSMGGIVASTAFRGGAPIETYAACQTAMVGHAYDPQFEERPKGATRPIDWETPDVYADYPPTDSPHFESVTNRTFNFYNEDDYALEGWEVIQNWKPNITEGYRCDAFNPALNDGNFLYVAYPPLTFPSDTYEIFAHCAEARSFALGTRSLNGAKGNFDLQNFSDDAFDFGGDPEDHSGQWNGTMMIRHEFWKILLRGAFGLESSKINN